MTAVAVPVVSVPASRNAVLRGSVLSHDGRPAAGAVVGLWAAWKGYDRRRDFLRVQKLAGKLRVGATGFLARVTPAVDGRFTVGAPDGVPHGIRNTGSERLVMLAVLSPAP